MSMASIEEQLLMCNHNKLDISLSSAPFFIIMIIIMRGFGERGGTAGRYPFFSYCLNVYT